MCATNKNRDAVPVEVEEGGIPDDRMLGVEVPGEDVSLYLDDQVKLQLRRLRSDIAVNGEPSGEKIDSLVRAIIDSMPEPLRQEITDIDALREDIANVFRDFFALVQRCKKERRQVTEQDIEDVGAAIITVFLKYHAHSSVNNPALAKRKVPADYDPTIVSNRKWLFGVNNTANVLLWVVSTVTTYIGAQYYAGTGIQWFERVVSYQCEPLFRMAIRSLLAVSAAVVTSQMVFKFKERWSKEVNEGQKGVAKGFIAAFGSISAGKGMRGAWRQLARLGVVPAIVMAAVFADGATNVAGVVAGVGGRADKAEQLEESRDDLNARVAQLERFLTTVSAVPTDMEEKATVDLTSEVAGTSVTGVATDGPVSRTKAALYNEEPLDLVVSGQYPRLQEELRGAVQNSDLMDGRTIRQDFESVTKDRAEQARDLLDGVKRAIMQLDPEKDIEFINVDIRQVVADLIKVTDAIGDMPEDMEERAELYNGVLQVIAEIALKSGAYPNAQASNLALLELPSVDIDRSVPEISEMKYRSFDEILLAATRGKDPFAKTLLWSLALILGIAATHGNQVFLWGTKTVYRQDRTKSAKVEGEYAKPRVDAIVNALTIALNSGPYANYFKKEPLREETVRAAVEGRIDEIVAELDKGSKRAGLGRRLLGMVGLGEVARGNSWKETEIARMHNLKMDAIGAIESNPNEVAGILSRILPGLITVGEVLNPDREISGSTLSAAEKLNDQHLHGENVRLQGEDLGNIMIAANELKIINATDEEIDEAEIALVALDTKYKAIVAGGIFPENKKGSSEVAAIIRQKGIDITVERFGNLGKRANNIARSVATYEDARKALDEIRGIVFPDDNLVASDESVRDARLSAEQAISNAKVTIMDKVAFMVCADIAESVTKATELANLVAGYDMARNALVQIDELKIGLPSLIAKGSAVDEDLSFYCESISAAKTAAEKSFDVLKSRVKNRVISLVLAEVDKMSERASDGIPDTELEDMFIRVGELGEERILGMVGENGYDQRLYDKAVSKSQALVRKIVTARDTIAARARSEEAAKATREERNEAMRKFAGLQSWSKTRAGFPVGVSRNVLADNLAMLLVGRTVAGGAGVAPINITELENAFDGYMAVVHAKREEAEARGDTGTVAGYRKMFEDACDDMNLLRERVVADRA
ncbi:MAG: hypothetical protein UV80_C0012G0016 [Candidatus Peregrinibacteria bacterium GW2011_GWF2_43_17]|nr:MAG: hypothetical protein UV80_C0012G0016 [Candidatus Peregrinibacteria bacterium GW2011_GWF2_43_17]KKT18984.1 MAG: hypothetical protein UW03_C0026G0009 [Candidatus Peregrinibacteria bacterium GW2011_GWA2_43_8]HAU39540.1 hypothetical protein [Candidatus Peregrinibacteria bacterium]